jgi:hypothetical protein
MHRLRQQIDACDRDLRDEVCFRVKRAADDCDATGCADLCHHRDVGLHDRVGQGLIVYRTAVESACREAEWHAGDARLNRHHGAGTLCRDYRRTVDLRGQELRQCRRTGVGVSDPVPIGDPDTIIKMFNSTVILRHDIELAAKRATSSTRVMAELVGEISRWYSTPSGMDATRSAEPKT